MTNDEINDIVEETIIKMGLQACAETKIGNWHLRGISSGEKKRLSISIEILTQPTVLLLDEPTSGLDSASAFFVIQVLKCIALDGRIVVCSIHQPSSHLFYLFDDLLLLSNGETIYFGDAKMAVKFFAEAGFPCPSRRNPSDHFLRCINSDFDKVAGSSLKSQAPTEIPMSSNSQMYLSTEEIKAKLVEEYRNSEISMDIRQRVRELAHNEQEETVLSKDRASWWKQLCILSHRSFLNMLRDMGYYWLRIVFYVLVSITVGILYLNVGLSNPAIYGRPKCVAFIYGFLICLSVGGLPSFIEEHKASYRERISCHYGEAVFVLSNFLSSFPFLVILSISSGTILHYMVQFHPGFSHYCHFCLSLFCCVSIVETCVMVVALLVPNVLMGIGVGTALIVLMMMVSPVFRGVSDLPKFFWQYPMSYITFATWAIEGQFKNDMIGLEFDPAVPGDPKLKGEEILLKLYGVQLNYCKWWDLAALFCILTCYKIVLFATLKYKDKASKLLHRLFARSIFRQTPQKDDVNNISVVP
ncbi:hypothetical protein WN943_027352 [Citrus x changshan-huyou]|nr:ABC transporter G family member 15 [Citrus sinensis]